MNIEALHFRLATPADGFLIMELYQEVYRGTYTDPLMSKFSLIKNFLETPHHFWFLAEKNGTPIASVLLRYDPENLLAKAFGAVVKETERGFGTMENLLQFGMDYVEKHTPGVDVVYATTRTVHEGAQALTEKLGYKKLGIFPNSHKTTDYETHCLTATFHQSALAKREAPYLLHSRLKGLVGLVSQELPELEKFEYIQPEAPTRKLVSPPVLEMIESEHFVKFRYQKLKDDRALQFTFFPFHEPNLLILSPDQSIEMFCYHSRTDGYSVILGGKVREDVNYTELFNSIANLLRDHSARYVEFLIRADKPKIIDSILRAKFIPSAFFPAFQLHHGIRYDYVVVSKTFEIFDFQNIRLKGLNLKFLEEYFHQWKSSSLNPSLLNEGGPSSAISYLPSTSHHPYFESQDANLDESLATAPQ